MLSAPPPSSPRSLGTSHSPPRLLSRSSVATAASRHVLSPRPIRDRALTPPVQIVPLLSQSSHPLPAGLAQEDYEKLTNRIQFGGDEVVKAKDGAGSATLSMAYAGADFAEKLIRAVKGEKGIVAPTFVNLSSDKEGGEVIKKEIGRDLDYFSAPVELGVSVHRSWHHLT